MASESSSSGGGIESPDEIAGFLAELVAEAGGIALRFFREGCAVREKVDGSPVTAADVQTEQFIADQLRRRYPGIPICGEEDDNRPLQTPDMPYFLVDPVDGTKEFVRGSTEWTVNIGLVFHGRPMAGAVAIPVHGAVYWGGRAAYAARIEGGKIGQKRMIRVQVNEGGPLRVLCSRDHREPQVDILFRRLGVTAPLAVGSSLKMLRIASGEADFYPRFGATMAWDTAAAHAVLAAAGGDLFTCDGATLTYDPQRLRNPSFAAYGAKALPASIVTALSGL